MAASGSNRRLLVIGCQAGLVLGVVLVIAGALWQSLVKPEYVWSDQQAQALQAARADWHKLLYNDPKAPTAAESTAQQQQREAAQRRYEQMQAELDAAIVSHRHRGRRLIYAGLAAMAVFGVGYLAIRRD